jgi:hypothetical protein
MKSIKLYAGIDYQFRPEPYWAAASNPLEAALRNVKGRSRRLLKQNRLSTRKLKNGENY